MAWLEEFSHWLRALLAPKAPTPARPDGHGLATLLFALADPLDFQALQWAGRAGSAMTPAQARAELQERSEIYFVADPSSMKALRDCGYIEDGPHGLQARKGSRTIPFFGYDGSVSFDNHHWGLELRRIGEADLAKRDLHALREQEATLIDEGAAPAKKSNPSSRYTRL